MKKQLALAAILLCISSSAWPQTPGPDVATYPDPQCTKPQVNLVKPTSLVDNYGTVYAYNAKVKAFNRDAAAYSACIHAYIDKANGDAKAVQDKANADLKQITERANASMKVIQDKIKQAAADANSVSATLNEDTAKLRSR